VCHYWYQNDNFHHELRMQRCIEQADWKGVVEEGEKQQGEPTRAIVMMHNLALSRLGRQCDEMYNFPKGSAKPDTELPVYMHNTAGRMIYYQYGILNECHRMCMEQGVNFGWTNELLQYLTRSALLGDERQVTRKYIDILKETLFYRGWAEHMEHLLNDREALLADAETGPVTHMLHHVDRKGSDDGYVEKYLMTILSETDADDLYFQEQAVLGAMWTRNNHDFWQRIAHYVELSPNGVIPRIFLEAACLFGTMEGRPDLEGNIDPQILKSFQGFMNQMEQCKGMSMPQMRKVLMPQYGHTYFFEYFFLKDIPISDDETPICYYSLGPAADRLRPRAPHEIRREPVAAHDLSRLYRRHHTREPGAADLPDGRACRRDGRAFCLWRPATDLQRQQDTTRRHRLADAGRGRQGPCHHRGRVCQREGAVDPLQALQDLCVARLDRPLYQLPTDCPVVCHLQRPDHQSALSGELRRECGL
jgi:hypothetical protein